MSKQPSLTPKFCIYCKHYIPSDTGTEYGKCKLFFTENNLKLDTDYLVDGISREEDKDYMYCSIIRGDEERCGKNGFFFDKKNMKTDTRNLFGFFEG
jgi:hypothetical protein